MKLTPDQMKKLHGAILAGFNGSDLEQLTRFELNERLDNLVSDGSLSEVVFGLIDWAEKSGRVADLIRAIQQGRPNNAEIQAVATQLLAASKPVAETAAGTAPLDGPRRARLRAALLDQFPTRTALAMLVDDSLSVNLSTVSAGTNLTEVVFELIQWASVDSKGQLKPLLIEAVKQRPNSAELKALKTELFGD